MTDYKEYPFKFTFVMPVYNVESYLRETVESILSQTFNFEDNCEIVFINDGSPDNVEAICLEYKEKYPANIQYIKQKNQGVSAARNNGINAAKGKYISFLDSDDLISKNTLTEVYKFFEEHSDIDVASIKMVFFEARRGTHMLNYKFRSTRVVDIRNEPDSIQLSGGSSFVRSTAAKKHKFDTTLAVAEDAKYLSEIILKNKKYGVVHKPTYYYRRRFSSNSALVGAHNNPKWYTYTLDNFHTYLLDLSDEETNKYIQYVVMYDLQWRLRQEHVPEALTQEELTQYKNGIKGLLKRIDDETIFRQRNINPAEKILALEQKNSSLTPELFSKAYGAFNPPIQMDFLEGSKDEFIIEGRLTAQLAKGYSLHFSINGIERGVKEVHRPKNWAFYLDEKFYDGGGFKVSLPKPKVDGKTSIRAYLKGPEGELLDVPIVPRRFTRLADISMSYRSIDEFLVSIYKGVLRVEPRTAVRHILRELGWLFRIATGLKLRYAYELITGLRVEPVDGLKGRLRPYLMPVKAALLNVYAIGFRLLHFGLKPLVRNHPIWIISDRTTAAGDNGEALFRYISSINKDSKKIYFAISKQSPDYERLKQYGKVLVWGSFWYKVLFVLSSRVISSHADDFIINPFGNRLQDFQDLFRFKYVFLQHGITKDDISSWLNRYSKDISMFVTSARPEYESILGDLYGYTKEQVKLTGMPRYDLLQSKPRRKLIIAPTWRKALTIGANQKTGTREHDSAFKHSEYYKFYQALLNDDTVMRALRKQGMTLDFYLHPSHAAQVSDFSGTNLVTIKSIPYDYRTAFSEGDILVTDYSSVAFDFAYLKKPIIYTQFDRQAFYGGHLYQEGYFSYETDGFGPVAYTYEETIRAIVDCIEADANMTKKYKNRVEKFFYKFDTRNSERVYKAIEKL